MDRRQLFQGRVLALSCLALLQWTSAQPALAQHTYPATGARPIASAQFKKQVPLPVRSGLNAFDKSELGNRTPLILVHGIGASASTQFNWERFLDYAEKQKPLMERYKIYLYHYDSSRSVPAISQNLQQTLKTFISEQGERKIKILAYSEGGLLTRNAMQDAYIDAHTDEVITLATPFHGSPLANPDWIRQQIKTDSPFSLVRIGQRIAYSITGKLYPTFKEDFRWDNFDGALPAAQYKESTTGKTEYALAKKEKFVTYGSYFGLALNPSVVPEALEIKAELPRERLIVGNLFRRNFLFSLVRNNIGKLPLAIRNANKPNEAAAAPAPSKAVIQQAIQEAVHQPDSTIKTASIMIALADQDAVHPDIPDGPVALELEKPASTEETLGKTNALMAVNDVQKLERQPEATTPVSMMMFNDGISPISSTLWLGRYMPQNSPGASVSVEKLWATLKKLKGNDNTRLFAGVDHRNWMDGTTRTGDKNIQDLLNPDEPPRTIFAWLVYDLMS